MEKIWLKRYPSDVPHEIDADRYPTILHVFEEACGEFRDKVAFSNMGVPMTFGETERRVKAFASFLQNDLGLQPGDRIALQLPNILQNPVALFGSLAAGLVVVNTNPLYTPREMQHQFKDSGAKAIVILENFADKLHEILKDTPIQHVILTQLADLFPTPKRILVNFVVKHIKKMVPAHGLKNTIDFREILAKGNPDTWKKPTLKSNDVAFLQYTGGTTGVAKGAMLTHRNICSNMEQMVAWIGPNLKRGEEISFTALPLYHVFCLTVNCMGLFKIGTHNVLITNPKDIPGTVKEFQKIKPTLFTVVNTLANAMMENESFRSTDFSPLRTVVAGGMALKPAVAQRWEKLTGIAILQGYGLTEASPVVSCNPLTGENRLGTIGLPLPNTEIRILGEDGKEVSAGEPGELCVRGPQVMAGYWQRPDETAQVLVGDGWLKTGDMATYDQDGYLSIVDRKKEMIIVSGFNVFPNEVEAVALENPKVLDAAAIGVPDDHSGEVVKLFVVKRDASLTQEEMRAFCKKNLTGYKVPKYVEFRDDLPKTNVGKVLRRALKEEEEAKKA